MRWRVLKDRFFSRPGADRRLILEAFILLGLARLALLFAPFRRMAPFLGEVMAESAHDATEHLHLAGRVSRAVETASRHAPWETTCLARAVAAKAMLRRRRVSSTLYLGLARDESDRLLAHAWLRHGSVILTGGPRHKGYTLIAAFSESQEIVDEKTKDHSARPPADGFVNGNANPSAAGRRHHREI